MRSQEDLLEFGDLVLRDGRVYRVVPGDDGPRLEDVTDRTASLDELAWRYGDETLIARWMEAGLPFRKLRNQFIFEIDRVESWLADHDVQAAPRDRSEPPPVPDAAHARAEEPAGQVAEPSTRYRRYTEVPSGSALDEWVGVAELVERYKLPGQVTVLRWVRRGLPHEVVGGMRVFRIADVESWLVKKGYDPKVLMAGKGLVGARVRTRPPRFRRRMDALRRRRTRQLQARTEGDEHADEDPGPKRRFRRRPRRRKGRRLRAPVN